MTVDTLGVARHDYCIVTQSNTLPCPTASSRILTDDKSCLFPPYLSPSPSYLSNLAYLSSYHLPLIGGASPRVLDLCAHQLAAATLGDLHGPAPNNLTVLSIHFPSVTGTPIHANQTADTLAHNASPPCGYGIEACRQGSRHREELPHRHPWGA